MYEKLYSDIEVAQHTVMLSNLPQDVPRHQLEQSLKELFDSLINMEELNREDGQSQVIKVVVVSKLSPLIK